MIGKQADSRGQILVIFAGGLIGLVGLMALAIDLSNVYSIQQKERSLADAAALAGAQELQSTTSRTIPSGAYTRARQYALASVAGALGAPAPTCDPAVNVIDCSIPPYLVSVKTNPSPSADNVDPFRAVQVTVRVPNVQLTFARLFNQNNWNVGITSVAGLGYGRSYTVITLRPPKQTGNTFEVNDIELNGNNTTVNVERGDVGTNANMRYPGSGAVLNLDPGYGLYYFDPYGGPAWVGPPSPPSRTVQKITTLIQDPGYRYPSMVDAQTDAQTFDDARTSQVQAVTPPGLAVERADLNGGCLALAQTVNTTAYSFMTAALASPSAIFCYSPGIYQSGSEAKNAQIVVEVGQVALLRPGAYYLRNGLDVRGRLIGGWEAGQPGVALMFDQSGPGNGGQNIFNGNAAETISLNAGTRFPTRATGNAATAALDWSGLKVETSGPSSPTPPLAITILVRKDRGGPGGTQGCVVPSSPPYLEPSTCNASQNQTIRIAGGGQLVIEGVQYAPTDNVAISGSADGNGRVGQIISWTITYGGGSTLNQEGPANQGAGILYLDAACSGGGNPCSP